MLIPKYPRRDLLNLFEDLAEVTLGRKVNILCDLLQRVVGIHQEVCGTEDTLFVDIILEALASLFLEELGQMGWADTDTLGNLVQIVLMLA